MLHGYIATSTTSLSVLFPAARCGRNLHLRHYPISKPGFRRKFGKLNQLENDLPFTVGFDTAEGAISEVHSPGGGQEALRPELYFIGIEMHGDVSHLGSYGPVSALVSLPAILEITTQFVTGSMDIGFDRSQGQIQRFRDFLVGIPLDVA